VLDKYAIGFRVMHGFTSATAVNDVAEDNDGRKLVVLYIGDFDPSGLFMSECDLPQRLVEYGGDHVELRRIALTQGQTVGQPSFPASDKRKGPRYQWFVERYGTRCWEIDAMDPRGDCTEQAITELIEPTAWERCEIVNAAELESLTTILTNWKGGVTQ
jgi:hypothetical protein